MLKSNRTTLLAAVILVSASVAGLFLAEVSHDEVYSQEEVKFRQTTPTKSGISPRFPVVPDSPRKTDEQLSGILGVASAHDAHVEIVVGQARLLTLNKDLAAEGRPSPVVSVGDPTILEMEILPNPRLIRLLGRRAGVTEVSITTSDAETYSIEVAVVYDIPVLDQRLKKLFPDAKLSLSQLHDHIVIEGQARSTQQANQILSVVRAYLSSVQVLVESKQRGTAQQGSGQAPSTGPAGNGGPQQAGGESQESGDLQVTIPVAQVINLIKVPEPQQVMLKVQVAELNRTALRQIGSDLLFSSQGKLIGTQIGGAAVTTGSSMGDGASLAGLLSTNPAGATAIGIFEAANAHIFLSALRRNSVLKILAEPNLVAMNGHTATFLAGGEFPIPVAQNGTGGGTSVTVEFREFGVQLAFEPFVMRDGNVRLAVSSQVSSIDFSLGTTLVPGGSPVPGLSTRNVKTTVELADGKTLMMAGLLQVSMDGTTSKIPGLGELPTLGPLFRNNTGQVQEKELIVLVTPYFVEAMNKEEVGSLPGDEVFEPDDYEFFWRGQTEGNSVAFRSTTSRHRAPGWSAILKVEERCVKGIYGYSH